MNESHFELPFSTTTNYNSNSSGVDIPTEVVSEDEMASIEAALAFASSSLSSSTVAELDNEEKLASIEASLASTRSSLSSSAVPAICSTSQSQSQSQYESFQRNARSIQSITLRVKRRFSFCTEPSDIEDLGSLRSNQKKKSRVAGSFFHRFRNKTGLFVTDITATEWCEKKMEFRLLSGQRKNTEAMKTGQARHAKLEEEVVKKLDLHVKSDEDAWAVKLTNFIIGANQLLLDGLTRELPLIGFAEGVWMVGMVDEVRMPVTETDRNPILVDIKTRVQDTLPAEPQRRNGRLQLMCYKYLWDNLVADSFPSKQFFDFFSLDPYYTLCKEIRENTAKSGFPVETLDDVVRCYRNICSKLSPAKHELLLRYEYQKDNSVLGEDRFAYDSDWLKSQIMSCLEFWLGEREANCTPKEERWKCWFCEFSCDCPTNTNPDSTQGPITDNPNSTPS
ncbi:exonuclease V, chloroplastic-like isoform X2 [Quercus robur]|uniref:exonuclease V, chloroplastic-like isoform X2 n=1 Tax=Quercus robur TaxID=38942 RepID=UPI0021639A21|nr:exonuclease V, chloroplastic-like isoform X2 [Quercus robur]